MFASAFTHLQRRHLGAVDRSSCRVQLHPAVNQHGQLVASKVQASQLTSIQTDDVAVVGGRHGGEDDTGYVNGVEKRRLPSFLIVTLTCLLFSRVAITSAKLLWLRMERRKNEV